MFCQHRPTKVVPEVEILAMFIKFVVISNISYCFILHIIIILNKNLSLSLVMVLLDFILRLENEVSQKSFLPTFVTTKTLLTCSGSFKKLVVGNGLCIPPTLLQKRRFQVFQTSCIRKHWKLFLLQSRLPSTTLQSHQATIHHCGVNFTNQTRVLLCRHTRARPWWCQNSQDHRNWVPQIGESEEWLYQLTKWSYS